jgi:UDP-3-O-[3-hydroxymyristoyl] N-acetylglucosamine deacetylase
MVRIHAHAQTTLAEAVTLNGIGVHSGAPVSLTLHPTDANTGIVFLKTDAASGRETEIRADWRMVSATELCTAIGDASTGSVATIEHLMSALMGLGVDNVLVEIDGAEVPIMDGSASDFVAAIDAVGLVALGARRRYIKVLKPIRIESGAGFAELRPYEGRRFDVTIDFQAAVIGRQSMVTELTADAYRRQIARARTFGFVKDLEKLLPMGLCRGSSLENSVGLKDDRVLNPEGLRFVDEFVRHKTLDAIGDLALAGAPILGAFRSYRGGHRMNFQTLQALFADTSAWTLTDTVARREPVGADIGLGAGAVFGPEVA